MAYFKKDMIYKGYSRIFVKNPKDIAIVDKILKRIDADEYDGYMPEHLIAVYQKTEPLVYNGKFDLNIDEFYKLCFLEDVCAYVVTKDDDMSW